MDAKDQIVLKKAIYHLVINLKITTRFKAALESTSLLTDAELNQVFKKDDLEENALDIIRIIKKGNASAFDRFLGVLRRTKQIDLVTYLEDLRAKEGNVVTRIGTEDSGQTASTVKDPTERDHRHGPLKVQTDVVTEMEHQNVNRTPMGAKGATQMSREELRTKLKEIMPTQGHSPAKGDVVVSKDWKAACYEFIKGSSHKPPGPFRGLEERPSHHNSNIGTLPPMAVATLCRLLGGQTGCIYNTRDHMQVFLSVDMETKYVIVELILMPKSKSLGIWWFNVNVSLLSAIEASVGWSPNRARNKGTMLTDIDLSETVLQWWKYYKKTDIEVWPPS